MVSAIPTRYRHVLFRSRLEARWAVFFDSLAISWHYEPEGFNLHGLYYVPDFFLPSIGWIEVKPCQPDENALAKMQALALATQRDTFVTFGSFPDPRRVGRGGPSEPEGSMILNGGRDYHYTFCECMTCGFIGVAFDARSARLPCHLDSVDDKAYSGNSPRILDAYDRAWSYRFW